MRRGAIMPARRRAVLPRAALSAAALAAAAVLGACGGHGEAVRTITVGAAQAPRQGPLTAAKANAYAAFVNLKPSDLPGFTARARGEEKETPQEQHIQERLLTCVGAQPRIESGSGETTHGSPWFTHRSILNQSVSSSVSFLKSAAAGAQELAVLRSSRARHCLSRYLSELFTGRHYGEAVIRHVSVAQGIPPAPGTTGGYAWRMRADVQIGGRLLPFYLDTLGFIYGQAEVRLLSSSLIVPFPATAEEELYRLLLRRAKAYPL
jgi:hypothetical protein